MEEHYMSLIWHTIGAKENQGLSNSEVQQKIVDILSNMKKDVETFTKASFKKECVKAVENSLKDL